MTAQQLLEDDHESLGRRLGEFELALGANDLPKAFERLDLFWARLAIHIRAENLCLFPALLNAARALPPREGQDPRPDIEEVMDAVAQLREDHNFFMDSLAKAIKIMREILSHPDAEHGQRIEATGHIIAAVKQRLERHNAIEEDQLYRWPAILLDNSQLAQLQIDIKEQLQNLPLRFTN